VDQFGEPLHAFMQEAAGHLAIMTYIGGDRIGEDDRLALSRSSRRPHHPPVQPDWPEHCRVGKQQGLAAWADSTSSAAQS